MSRRLTGLWGVLFAVLVATAACQPINRQVWRRRRRLSPP